MRLAGHALGVALLLSAALQPRLIAAEEAATADTDTTVVLVMESGGGVRAASELRAALNRQPSVHLVSLAEASRQQARPAAVLTVATDPARVVSVIYWDLAGNTDSLSAPAPAGAGQIDVVIMALTSALLDRHRAELNARSADGGPRPLASPLTSSAFYAMLGRLGRMTPRTSVQLRVEDF
jgi:predicted nucleotide-binding protein (sugar kinase/HSP70/actin superfamily)